MFEKMKNKLGEWELSFHAGYLQQVPIYRADNFLTRRAERVVRRWVETNKDEALQIFEATHADFIEQAQQTPYTVRYFIYPYLTDDGYLSLKVMGELGFQFEALTTGLLCRLTQCGVRFTKNYPMPGSKVFPNEAFVEDMP